MMERKGKEQSNEGEETVWEEVLGRLEEERERGWERMREREEEGKVRARKQSRENTKARIKREVAECKEERLRTRGEGGA